MNTFNQRHYEQLCRLESAAINLLNAMSDGDDIIAIETARVDLQSEVSACQAIDVFSAMTHATADGEDDDG
jgi:hypothetical protein